MSIQINCTSGTVQNERGPAPTKRRKTIFVRTFALALGLLLGLGVAHGAVAGDSDNSGRRGGGHDDFDDDILIVQGPKGDQGNPGIQGAKGDKG